MSLKEKDLEIQRLRLTRDIMSLKSQEKSLNNTREELMEWSDIKTDLYQEAQAKGEIWSPDSIDGEGAGLQAVPLALRHIQNYLILIQNPSEGDISSVLNIQGLALGAVKDGMKTNRLGLYINSLTDLQIQVLFQGLYGKNMAIQRIPNFLIIKDQENGQELLYPANFEMWQNINNASK